MLYTKMPSVGTKSIEQLYEKLKDKKILEDQDTCFYSLSFCINMSHGYTIHTSLSGFYR